MLARHELELRTFTSAEDINYYFKVLKVWELQQPQPSSMPELPPERSDVPASLALLINGVQRASPADAEQQ